MLSIQGLTTPLIAVTVLSISVLTFQYGYATGGEPRSLVSSDGILLVDGTPTFLLGFYYESRNRTTEETRRALEKMSDAGFNTVYLNTLGRLDEFKHVLDMAAQVGMHVVAEGPRWEETVTRLGNHPSLLAWSVGDDMGDHDPAEAIAAKTHEVHRLVPGLLTYGSVSGWSRRWEENAHTVDLVGGQSYPIDYPFGNRPPGIAHPHTEPYHVFARGARAAAWHGHPAIANVQAFSWSEQRSNVPVWPSGSEVRNMAYQAVAAGAKGVLFYTWEGKQGPSQGEELWEACRRMSTELPSLIPEVATSRPVPMHTQDAEVFAAYWPSEDGLLLLVVNTSKWEVEEVELRLPEGIEGTLRQVVGDGESVVATRSGHKLSVRLNKLALAAYRMDMRRALSHTYDKE